MTTEPITPAGRKLALARAKAVCFHFAEAVRKHDAKMIQHICDGLSREELAALAIIGYAALPDLVGLKIVKDAEP